VSGWTSSTFDVGTTERNGRLWLLIIDSMSSSVRIVDVADGEPALSEAVAIAAHAVVKS